MAIVKIEEVFLYTSEYVGDAIQNIQANAFMEKSGVPYTKLFYNELNQSNEVLNTVNTWFARPDVNLPPLETYPFIVYTEVHDDIPARYSPVKYVSGKENIENFPAFYFSINKA